MLSVEVWWWREREESPDSGPEIIFNMGDPMAVFILGDQIWPQNDSKLIIYVIAREE